jgi:3-deoxy-manno-octulosonate cytidylyltransferase (CMP-KDO synthetase)
MPATPSAPSNPIVIVPARLDASRLPDKVLADINGVPMVVHAWRRGMEAGIGPVVVAASAPVIAEAVEKAGGKAVLTDPDLPSGSDRIHQALARLDPDRTYDAVVNLQGDLPNIGPAQIKAAFDLLSDPAVDIGTLAAEIVNPEDRDNPNAVKAVVAFAPGARRGRALYFTRATAPFGDGPLFHHFGLYAYRRAALERFVSLPPGILEQRERLEQLRAIEAGMRIDVALIDTIPLDVNTPADLERARALLAR